MYETDENETTRALAVVSPAAQMGMVRPLVNPAAAKQAIAEYEGLKAAIVRKDDVQKIQGRDFLKKSFWRRVATCFGLSLELVSEERGHDERGGLFYSVIYRAVAPNGRTMIGDGYCSQSEQGRGGWPEHNVRATAHTRAKNRAISDLVGGGEVSAEEMGDYVDEAPSATQQPRQAQQTRTTIRPAAPASKATPAKSGPTWSELRQRAVALGFATQDRWEHLCRQATGKDDPKTYTDEDRAQVASTLAQLEAEQPDAADLATLGTVVP